MPRTRLDGAYIYKASTGTIVKAYVHLTNAYRVDLEYGDGSPALTYYTDNDDLAEEIEATRKRWEGRSGR